MRAEKFLEMHPVSLTQTELDERAREAAALALEVEAKAKELERYKEDTKAAAKALENEQKALEQRLFALGRVVKSRREPRNVECSERVRGALVETTREDTGEVVSSRPATRAEMEEASQVTLFPGGGATAPKKGKGGPKDPAPAN